MALIWVLPTVTACSSGESSSRGTSEGPAREFSEADKIAARALSISNNQVMANAETPYARAILCKNGMDLITERFRGGGALDEEQQQAILQAQAYFDHQLQSLAAAEGKTADDIRSDLEKVSEGIDPGDSGRAALDCLRRLQEGA